MDYITPSTIKNIFKKVEDFEIKKYNAKFKIATISAFDRLSFAEKMEAAGDDATKTYGATLFLINATVVDDDLNNMLFSDDELKSLPFDIINKLSTHIMEFNGFNKSQDEITENL